MPKKAKKALVISTFPPKKCGVGTYAQEQVNYLKRQGWRTYSLAYDDGCVASYRLPFGSLGSMLRALILIWVTRFDAVYLHFTDGLVFPGGRRITKALQYLWLAMLAIRYPRRLTMIGHEIETAQLSRRKKQIHQLLYAAIAKIEVHTVKEREDLLSTFKPFVRPSQVHVVDHERFMRPRFLGGKYDARLALGLPMTKTIFLCIGFIQRHKGFDQAVTAAEAIDDNDKQLYVVGSTRVKAPDILAYRDELAQQIEGSRYCFLHEQFIDDTAFDTWIAAADYVILPYHEIWSSGVGARAVMIGTGLIVKDHPNLRDQFRNQEQVYFYQDHDALVKLMGSVGPRPEKSRQVRLVDHYTSRAELAEAVFSKKRILVVMPCFGMKVRGGAESFVFRLVEELVARGAKIEVWTSDSSDVVRRNHSLRKDSSDLESGIRMKRFPANVWSRRLFDRVHRRMNMPDQCGPLLQPIWVATNLTGKGMEKELVRRAHEFDVIHLFHYLGGSTHRLSGYFPEKTLLHPFIHDEPPLHNPVMRHLFSGVAGVTCNTYASRSLALRARTGASWEQFVAIGNGVNPAQIAPQTHPIVEGLAGRPYLVFIGRMIGEKNLALLFQWHQTLLKAWPSGPALICIGEGPMAQHSVFTEDAKNFYTLGWIHEGEKRFILRNSLALVQLSLLESFSLVVVEAWREGIPVITHKLCLATSDLMERSSSAGFAVEDQKQFEGAVRQLIEHPEDRRRLGSLGQSFVEREFSWDAICENYAYALAKLLHWDAEERTHPLNLIGIEDPPRTSLADRKASGVAGGDFYVSYEESLRSLEVVPPSWPYYMEQWLKPLAKGALLIDMGAGRGDFLRYVSQHAPQLQGIGVDPDYMSFLKMRNSGVPSCWMSAERFAERSLFSTVDAVVLMHVVEHIPFPQLGILLAKIRQILKPGGLLIIEFPDCWSVLTSSVYFWMDPTHIRPLLPPTLNMLFSKLGFEVVTTEEFAPHLSEEEEAQLVQAIGYEKMVKSFYGKQDFVFICRRIEK